MQRILIPWMLDVSASLDQLDALVAGAPIDDYFVTLFTLQQQLEALYNQSVYSHYLRSSREFGNQLHAAIEGLFGEDLDLYKLLTDQDIFKIVSARNNFRLVFRSEISTIPIYIVTRKENYDLSLLIEDGVGLFPGSLLSRVPEAAADAAEVGKCLAFEVPTSCGFHTYRVVEAVLRRYWDQVTGKRKRPEPETLGKFAAELQDGKFGDIKIIEAIKQLAKLHRNPLAHPDVILTNDEAIAAIGMARSVITHMLAVLPEVPPTTGAPSS